MLVQVQMPAKLLIIFYLSLKRKSFFNYVQEELPDNINSIST